MRGRLRRQSLRLEPGAASAAWLATTRRAPRNAAGQPPWPARIGGREVPRWSAERRASRSQGTQRRLPSSGVSTCRQKHVRVPRRTEAPPRLSALRSPSLARKSGKEGGANETLRRSRRRKTNGRQSYAPSED